MPTPRYQNPPISRSFLWFRTTVSWEEDAWQVENYYNEDETLEILALQLGHIGQFDASTPKCTPEREMWMAVVVHVARDASRAHTLMGNGRSEGPDLAMEIAEYLWTRDFEIVCELAGLELGKTRGAVIDILDGRLEISWSGYRREPA